MAMQIEELFNLVGSVGFPIAAWYLMYRMTSDTLQKLNDTIANNTLTIQRLADEISFLKNANSNSGGDSDDLR